MALAGEAIAEERGAPSAITARHVVAAVVGRRQDFLGQRLEVAADDPTPAAMADAIAGVSGRPVAYRELPISEVTARNADIAAMYRFLGSVGYRVDSAAVAARFPELTMTTFHDWVEHDLVPAQL